MRVRDITELPPVPADRRIAYGDAPAQFFDIFLPSGTIRGTVMNIHGGFWRAKYDLQHASHLCRALAEKGLAVANIEYRRVGDVGGGWPGSFEDVLSGFDSVTADFGIPLVIGHSAGGHLALRLASERHSAGVVALAPVADLQLAYQLNLSKGAVAEFLGGTPSTVGAVYTAADAKDHASEVSRILIHGTNDDVVPIALSESYIRARSDDPGIVRLERLEGGDHFGLIDPESVEWPQVEAAVFGLFRPK